MHQLLKFFNGIALVLVFSLCLGCGGSGKDEVLEHDPEVTKQKAAEYEKQMKEAMKKQGQQGRQGR